MSNLCRATLLSAWTLAFAANSAFAMQLVETRVQKNANGTTTYHFAVKTAPGETVTPGEDFVTVYNFYGLVHGSMKSPAGWSASSEEFGKTPTWAGYPAVLPVDVPGTPNLTWTPSAAIDGGSQIDGFSATTRESGTTRGMYSAQVTRAEPDANGQSKSAKQAVVGDIRTPRFLTK